MITDTRAKIFSYIGEHGKIRVHDLVRVFHLSSVAIHKQLNKLLQEGKIQKVGKPPLVFYAQKKQNLDLEDIKQKAVPILKEARVKKAALFGSYVRGDATKDSDIDILVDLSKNATLLDLVGIKQDLEEVLQKKVDVITYRGIDPLLKKSILNNQYLLL